MSEGDEGVTRKWKIFFIFFRRMEDRAHTGKSPTYCQPEGLAIKIDTTSPKRL